MLKLVCTACARSVFGMPLVGFEYLPFQPASFPSIALIRSLKPLSITSCAEAVRYVLGTACRAVAPFPAPLRMFSRSLIVSCLSARAVSTAEFVVKPLSFSKSLSFEGISICCASTVSILSPDTPPPPPVADMVFPSAAIVMLSPAISLSCLPFHAVRSAAVTCFILSER